MNYLLTIKVILRSFKLVLVLKVNFLKRYIIGVNVCRSFMEVT